MIRRNIENKLRQAMADTPVVLLHGARQTGKTTLVKSLATPSPQTAYITFDEIGPLSLASRDPHGFVRNLPRMAVLDEVQKVPALFPALKLEVDQNRLPGRFLLTGSANVMMLPALSESLAGRMEIIPLYPFAQGELEGRTETFLARMMAERIEPCGPQPPFAPCLAERLARGGFPEAVLREDESRRDAWFTAYISTILQREVKDVFRVEDLTRLPHLLALLASRTAGLLNLAGVGRDAGIPHSTLTRHLAFFEALFMVCRVPAWSANLGQRLVKAPKLHVVDSGLACHLAGVNAARLQANPGLMGHHLESFVVAELLKQASWTSPPVSLFHFRTGAGCEVDLLLEDRQGRLVAVEIKSAATVQARDFEPLKKLAVLVGRKFLRGLVLYTGAQPLPFGDDCWAWPLWDLWA